MAFNTTSSWPNEMTIPVYKTILFVHIISAMVLFTSLAFEWTSLSLLTARNQTLDLGFWLRIAVRAALAGVVSAIAAAVSGAFMMATAWRREAWLAVAMGPLVPFAALSVVVTLRMSQARSDAQMKEGLPATDLLKLKTPPCVAEPPPAAA